MGCAQSTAAVEAKASDRGAELATLIAEPPPARHPKLAALVDGAFRLICSPSSPLPVAADLVYSSVVTVPALPAGPVEQWADTQYLWFNLWFDNNTSVAAAINNQFSSQLVLGGIWAQAGQGPPFYQPVSGKVTSYHIQAQYFMKFDPSGSKYPSELASGTATVTGRLVAVEPGESVYTTFHISADHSTWTLRVGVLGYGPERESVIEVPKPFMGLLDVDGLDLQWRDYDTVLAGCNWEIYGAKGPGSVPTGMSYDVAIAGTKPRRWTPWANSKAGSVPSTLAMECSNVYPDGQGTAAGEYLTQQTRFNISTRP